MTRPFRSCWSLPGCVVDRADEDLARLAKRSLAHDIGIVGIDLRQVGAFVDPVRDPSGGAICIVYVGSVDNRTRTATSGPRVLELGWFNAHDLPDMAFDHCRLICAALDTLEPVRTIVMDPDEMTERVVMVRGIGPMVSGPPLPTLGTATVVVLVLFVAAWIVSFLASMR